VTPGKAPNITIHNAGAGFTATLAAYRMLTAQAD